MLRGVPFTPALQTIVYRRHCSPSSALFRTPPPPHMNHLRSAFLFAALVPAALAAQARAVAPCTKAVTACERWITFGKGPARSKVYGTYALDVPNRAITRALIMVHGAGRNADHYFETSTGAAFLAGALENTIVLAPRFAAARDTVAANEILWPEGGNSWRGGGMSPTVSTISAFDLVDDIIKKLADKKTFPN